jgi:hypothetical protein
MDRDNFNITLFSNASQYIYPDNKIAAFTTQLAQAIRFDPSEIFSYPESQQHLQLLNLNVFVNALMQCDLIAPQLIGTAVRCKIV